MSDLGEKNPYRSVGVTKCIVSAGDDVVVVTQARQPSLSSRHCTRFHHFIVFDDVNHGQTLDMQIVEKILSQYRGVTATQHLDVKVRDVGPHDVCPARPVLAQYRHRTNETHSH